MSDEPKTVADLDAEISRLCAERARLRMAATIPSLLPWKDDIIHTQWGWLTRGLDNLTSVSINAVKDADTDRAIAQFPGRLRATAAEIEQLLASGGEAKS